jgi:hypothetical protein
MKFVKRLNIICNEFHLIKDIINTIINFLNDQKLISYYKNIPNNIEERKINEIFQILVILLEIESILFDFINFEIEDNFDKEDASLLIGLDDNKLALLNGSKISIYKKKIMFIIL